MLEMRAYGRWWKVLVCLGMLLGAHSLPAQDSTAAKLYLQYRFVPPSNIKSPPVRVFQDSLLLYKALAEQVAAWQQAGYLAAYCDSTSRQQDTIQAFINLGQAFVWGKVGWGNLPPLLLQAAFGKKTPRLEGKPFLWKEVEALQTRLLAAAENQGYPFAQLRLDSLHFEENRLSGRWDYQSGLLIALIVFG